MGPMLWTPAVSAGPAPMLPWLVPVQLNRTISLGLNPEALTE
jgi:hypothetical protein